MFHIKSDINQFSVLLKVWADYSSIKAYKNKADVVVK